jgi:hypothetical protein
VQEAEVKFTFEAAPLYLSCYAEAMDRVGEEVFREYDPELLRYAQVFERFAAVGGVGISRRASARIAASFYWLGGYSANAMVLARTLAQRPDATTTLRGLLTIVLARNEQLTNAISTTPQETGRHGSGDAMLLYFRNYLATGDDELIERIDIERRSRMERALSRSDAPEFVAGQLLSAVLQRLYSVSLWGTIRGHCSAPVSAWQRYATAQMKVRAPLVDLWPSQRKAVTQGLLDGESSLVLRMPTSAGKTKMTELAFVNDLFTDDRRCLYLAPFRALVSELELSLGPPLSDMGVAVASLYGGAEANDLEVELSQRARVVIATPEKMAAVLKMSGGKLTDFGTIVLDEGHLLGSLSRGAAYELQLASLRAEVIGRTDSGVAAPRVVFISAVLPNASTVADWIAGRPGALAEDVWHPTTLRIGVLTWPESGSARIRYVRQAGQPEELEFFVPRVLEEESWQERNPVSRRMRSYKFPDRTEKGAIAAALAFRYVARGPVIIYAQQPRWADSVAEKILARTSQDRPVDTNLVAQANARALSELADYVARRLGAGSVVARALKVGVGLHHGGVPITIRLAIEDAFRTQVVRLLIATNTISQGVNFPVKTVILHSFPAGDAPVREFWNLVGRAGRAMKETDGEVLLLLTGETQPSTIRKFLRRSNIEPVESRILQFVDAILEAYPAVSADTLRAMLEEDGALDEPQWGAVVSAIDTQLLEVMVEDLAEADATAVDTLVENLLARHQAEEDLNGAALLEGLTALFDLRRDSLRDLVPDAAMRRRFARTGVSAASALALDQQVPALRDVLAGAPELTDSAFQTVIAVACECPELDSVDAAQVTRLGLVWMRSGNYADVFEAGGFESLDDAVHYVEKTLAYSLPWILNGLLRLLESDDGTANVVSTSAGIPNWVRYLPQFLRYGVNAIELVWIMSLGIPDPLFAAWVRERFIRDVGRSPLAFREILAWALDHQEQLRDSAEREWPRYFARLLGNVLERYAEVSRVLGESE